MISYKHVLKLWESLWTSTWLRVDCYISTVGKKVRSPCPFLHSGTRWCCMPITYWVLFLYCDESKVKVLVKKFLVLWTPIVTWPSRGCPYNFKVSAKILFQPWSELILYNQLWHPESSLLNPNIYPLERVVLFVLTFVDVCSLAYVGTV